MRRLSVFSLSCALERTIPRAIFPFGKRMVEPFEYVKVNMEATLKGG
jgi:hypothetical protein